MEIDSTTGKETEVVAIGGEYHSFQQPRLFSKENIKRSAKSHNTVRENAETEA
jgi:hypothetical protein